MTIHENVLDPHGRFEMSPTGPFEAGACTTILFRVVIGAAGLKAGGCVKIATPYMGWGQPFCVKSRLWDELLVGVDRVHNPWKPINTTWRLKTDGAATLRLSADENLLFNPPGQAHFPDEWKHTYGQWRWWITATLEREDLRQGDEILITYGDTDNEPFGIRVQPWAEEQPADFLAVIDPDGRNRYHMIPGAPVWVRVVPGPAERIVAVIPGIARRGEKISVRTSVLDRNLCPPAAPGRGPLTFEADGLTLAASEAPPGEPLHATVLQGGVVHVQAPQLRPTDTNPLVVDETMSERLFWGDLHAQSRYHQWRKQQGRGDSCGTPREVHAYARDCTLLDFVAITDSGGAYTRSPGWEETQIAAADCYEPGRYVSLKGWECGCSKQGDKCVVYRSTEIEPHIPYMYELVEQGKAPTPFHALTQFYKNHKERVLTIPHSFMKYLDWSVVDPELDRVMEVYSTWGSYEARMDNPLNSKKKPGNQSAQHAWRLGYILGVTAAGDSHLGYPGRSIPRADRYLCQCFKAGLCAVYATELTREAVWDALYNRSCYGTTGVRIVLQFSLNDAPMGSVLEYAPGDNALVRRCLKVCVAGTDFIRRVDILKNNRLVHRHEPRNDKAEFVFTDELTDEPKTRDWYYARVFQADGNAAWSSPVWIAPHACAVPSPSDRE